MSTIQVFIMWVV